MAQGLDNRCHRDDGLLGACCLVAMANDLDVDKRTHTIVHADDALGTVWNQRKAVLHGVKARFSTISKLVVQREVVLFAELLPVGLLCLGQHKNYLQIPGVFVKTLQGPHQNRLPAYGQKLFGNVASHTQAFTACDDDDIIHYAIRCLNRIPSAIWSLTSLLTSCERSS